MDALNNYKLGSLFDGSGGFPLAGALCGIEPVWAAEVEPYPIAVTRSRFPNMKHLGDISKVNGAEIEPVDIITFGSPCQDLSVAGKRAGLKHEANGDEETTRSGLFMEAVRIIKEMRMATNGQYPRFALWENVPGAFSSNKGEDFRIVCEELIKIIEPSATMPGVPKNGWAYADYYHGDGWSLAYRVFDAQYWGVPQRRRRIHLVADFRGERAKEILFERQGVRGYFEEGRTPWQRTAADAQGCTGADDREGEGSDPYNGDLTGEVSATLGVNCGVSTGRNGVIERGRQLDAVINSHILDDQGGQVMRVITNGKAPTLRAQMGGHPPVVLQPTVCFQHQAGAEASLCIADNLGPTINCTRTPAVCYSFDSLASNSMKSKNPHEPVYCLQGNGIDRADTAGCNGKGWRENESYTLNTIDRPAVAFAANQRDEVRDIGTKVTALQAQPGMKQQTFIIQAPCYTVRRLTPTECARLQGFADCWGHIEKKDSLTDEEYNFWLEVRNTHAVINGRNAQDYTEKQMLTWYNKLWTDSAEYKMWGNGIALPPALYCLQGIVDALTADEDTDDWMN